MTEWIKLSKVVIFLQHQPSFTGYGVSVDWWSLGVLVHEMVAGVTPWRHRDIMILYDMILGQDFSWHQLDSGAVTSHVSDGGNY